MTIVGRAILTLGGRLAVTTLFTCMLIGGLMTALVIATLIRRLAGSAAVICILSRRVIAVTLLARSLRRGLLVVAGARGRVRIR